LETQKTVNIQGNTEQKEPSWRYHNTWLQTIPQSHSNKNSIILAQKKIWKQVEQNRGHRYESTHLHPPNFWHCFPKHMMEKRQHLQQMLLEKLVMYLQKTETRSMPVTLYKYQFKVDKGT
jgi:site-specific recombinase XerC